MWCQNLSAPYGTLFLLKYKALPILFLLLDQATTVFTTDCWSISDFFALVTKVQISNLWFSGINDFKLSGFKLGISPCRFMTNS